MIKETKKVFTKFLGIFNSQDKFKARAKNDGLYFQECVNCDIDDAFRLMLRSGITTIDSKSWHSLWGSSEFDTGLGIANGDLYTIHPSSNTVTLIQENVGNTEMDYDVVDDRIYCSNEQTIGIVRNWIWEDLPSTTLEFKRVMPPGRFVCYYRGRLYVAVRDYIVYSDPYSHLYDIRKSFIQFPSRITALRCVNDGLVVGYDNEIVFLNGDDPEKFKQSILNNSGAVEGTAVNIFGEYYGRTFSDKNVFLATKGGSCLKIGNGGIYSDPHGEIYNYGMKNSGAAAIYSNGDLRRYVAILN